MCIFKSEEMLCIKCFGFESILDIKIYKDKNSFIELSIRPYNNSIILRIAWWNYHPNDHWYFGPPSWLCSSCSMREIKDGKINWIDHDLNWHIMLPIIPKANNLVDNFFKLKAFL